MLALYFLAFVMVLTNCVHEEEFKTDLKYPKCCPKGHHLELDPDKNVTCARNIEGLYLTLDATTQALEKYPEGCRGKCVDAMMLSFSDSEFVLYDCQQKSYHNWTGYVAYPKCCPLNRRYDLKGHRCVALGQPRQVENLYVTVGMGKCTGTDFVITDHKKSSTSISSDHVLNLDGVKYEYGNYCLDQDAETGDDIVRICERYQSVCKWAFEEPGIPCFKMCCPDGQVYYWNDTKTCVATFNEAYHFNVTCRFRGINDSHFNYGVLYPGNRLKYSIKDEHKFFLDKWGSLHIREYGAWKTYSSQDATYCLGFIVNETTSTDALFLYFPPQNFDKLRFTMAAVVLCTSAVALFLTFLGYLILPEMQNLFGKLIMTYCIVHGVGFSLLAWSQLHYDSEYCNTVGFVIQFFMLAVFSWLSVICFHMWTAFGQFRIITKTRKEKNRKILFFYNLFAWSYPTFWVTLTLISRYTKFLPPNFTPNLGMNHCFFEKYAGSYDFLIYFLIPESILVITNTIFYVKTVHYCTKVKKEINEMKDSVNEKSRRKRALLVDRENLYMLLKLGFVMGVNWVFELLTSVVSFRNDPNLFWIEGFFDYFNCSQGIFIFCIFMLKKKVLVPIQKRLGMKITQTSPECSTTVTNLYSNKLSTGFTLKPSEANGNQFLKYPKY